MYSQVGGVCLTVTPIFRFVKQLLYSWDKRAALAAIFSHYFVLKLFDFVLSASNVIEQKESNDLIFLIRATHTHRYTY